jgi:hypothetical protein
MKKARTGPADVVGRRDDCVLLDPPDAAAAADDVEAEEDGRGKVLFNADDGLLSVEEAVALLEATGCCVRLIWRGCLLVEE